MGMDPASTTPIADAVAERRAAAPPHEPTPFELEQQARGAAGIPADILPVGSPFPTAELLDRFGDATTLSDAAGGRPAVVVFYRGAWCPYCNLALRTYRTELAPTLAARGIALIAVSPQKADGSLTMAEKLELEFPVLSDPGNRLGAGLGILMQPSDEARAMQLANGLDLTELNADGTATIPMPTTAIVDAGGVLRWIDVHPDYSTRTEPALVLDAIESLRPAL